MKLMKYVNSKADGGGDLSNAPTANINLYGLDISSTGAGDPVLKEKLLLQVHN